MRKLKVNLKLNLSSILKSPKKLKKNPNDHVQHQSNIRILGYGTLKASIFFKMHMTPKYSYV